jgi:hypothetical protein
MNNNRNNNNNRFLSRKKNKKTKTIPVFAPNKMMVKLNYTDGSQLRNNIGSSYLFFKMRGNSVFDPDPLLLTGGITGFPEWGGLYRRYLVTKVRVEWKVTNMESFPLSVCFAPSLADITTIVSSKNAAADVGEMKLGQVADLSAAGGMDRALINSTIDCATFMGNVNEYLDSGTWAGFAGAAASNPNQYIFLNFTVYSSNVLSSGIFSTLRIHYTVKFYEVQTPIDRTFDRNSLLQEREFTFVKNVN